MENCLEKVLHARKIAAHDQAGNKSGTSGPIRVTTRRKSSASSYSSRCKGGSLFTVHAFLLLTTQLIAPSTTPAAPSHTSGSTATPSRPSTTPCIPRETTAAFPESLPTLRHCSG